ALPTDVELMDDGGAADGTTAAGESRTGRALAVAARDVERYNGDVEGALKDLADLVHDGWRLILTTEGPGPARRMSEQLAAGDVPARLVEEVAEEPPPSVVLVT